MSQRGECNLSCRPTVGTTALIMLCTSNSIAQPQFDRDGMVDLQTVDVLMRTRLSELEPAAVGGSVRRNE